MAILDAAHRLFHEQPYEAITMAAVAVRAGLAKGTLYLYFSTKEELFLQVALAEIGQWLDHLDKSLDRGLKGRNVGDLMVRTLRPRQDLLRLLSILHAILERNVGDATVLAFKRSVLARVVATGARLERALPFLRSGEGVRILFRIYALVVGLWQVAVPGPVVARVLADPSVRAMRIDFFGALGEMLDALFAGLAFQRRHG
ncbi:MAG: TetR family transcriptional regulator [Acidobacteria bacterium]|nr:TetR family transcriptional regulator [Acidobacteriota bacterium]